MSELAEPVNTRKTTRIKTLHIFEASGDYTDTLINAQKFAEKEGIGLSNPYYAGMSQLEINNINRILSEKYKLSALISMITRLPESLWYRYSSRRSAWMTQKKKTRMAQQGFSNHRMAVALLSKFGVGPW
ncbi:hypothetical protein ML8HA_02696 [Lactococcus lactis]|nr:hypothetical protein [Lactococcus lactis]